MFSVRWEYLLENNRWFVFDVRLARSALWGSWWTWLWVGLTLKRIFILFCSLKLCDRIFSIRLYFQFRLVQKLKRMEALHELLSHRFSENRKSACRSKLFAVLLSTWTFCVSISVFPIKIWFQFQDSTFSHTPCVWWSISSNTPCVW